MRTYVIEERNGGEYGIGVKLVKADNSEVRASERRVLRR